jgi:hypothetical protein
LSRRVFDQARRGTLDNATVLTPSGLQDLATALQVPPQGGFLFVAEKVTALLSGARFQQAGRYASKLSNDWHRRRGVLICA